MGRFEDYRTFRTALGGRLLEVEIGKLAEQANGQATVRYGDTVVSCTVCASKEPKQDVDFFPLTCNFEEKLYAVGKIPGGYIKREGRPSDKATLTSEGLQKRCSRYCHSTVGRSRLLTGSGIAHRYIDSDRYL